MTIQSGTTYKPKNHGENNFFFCICGCREKRITPTSTKLIRRTRTGKRVRSKQKECAHKGDTCQGKMADGIWNERPTE
jgi:hypothetical protein